MTDTSDPTPDPAVDDDLDGGTSQEQDPAGEDGPNREAQRQRARRREAEAERDAVSAERDILRERITGYQRADVERTAATVLVDPADLWDVGRLDLASVLNEAGDVDTEAVVSAAQALVRERGQRFAHPRADFDGGADRGGRPMPPVSSWDAVFSSAYRDRVARAGGRP